MTDTFGTHRTGYDANPLPQIRDRARRGFTLAAGEGATLEAEIARLEAVLRAIAGERP